jgi:trigger factor
LTEDLVKKISLTCDTVEEYRAEQRAALEESNKETRHYELQGRVWGALIEECSVETYPEDMMEEQMTALKDIFGDLLNTYSLDELCKMYWGIDSNTYVTNIVVQTLAADAIAEKEGIKVTEEDYQKYLAEYAETYGYDDVAEFESVVGEEALSRDFINTKVADFLVENCILK